VILRPLLLVVPEAAIAEEMSAIGALAKRDYALRGASIATHQLHVTLHDFEPLTDEPEDVVARLKKAAGSVAMQPFDVAFDVMEQWPGTLVLRGDATTGLRYLQRALGLALKRFGFGGIKSSFTPHISLVRGKGRAENQMVKTFRWTVHDFVLVNSVIGESRYIPLARWPLGSPVTG
jgi:2'-5' RNA ligase